MKYKYKNCMIAWTPKYDFNRGNETRGCAEVGQWPDKTGWSKKYQRTVGGCNFDIQQGDKIENLLSIFMEFNVLVVRDGINPQVAHEAFLDIEEYAKHIAPDMRGAR